MKNNYYEVVQVTSYLTSQTDQKLQSYDHEAQHNQTVRVQQHQLRY